jgi:integrase
MPLRLRRREGSPFWWIEGTIGGTRVRESSQTADQRRAEEFRAVREAELYRHAVHGTPTQRRVAFATAIISYIEAKAPSAPTKTRVARLLRHFGASATCESIGQEALDEACRKLLRPGAKPATRLREVLTPARAVLTHAARRGWCAVPVLEQVAVSPARTGWMTPDEVDRLLEHAADHLRPLLTFLAGTGSRLGEALDLDWQDVDLAHARATLRQTKNGRDRILDLCPRAVAALAGLHGRTGVVFRTRSGRPYAAKRVQGGGQIKTGWASACRAAGLSGVSPHTLRHTWATWHYAMHRDLLALRTDGGWRTASQVERYAKLAPEGMAAEMQAWRRDLIKTPS